MNYGDAGLDYGSIGSALKSGGLLAFVLFFWNKIKYSERKERVWANGCFFATIFHIMAIKVLMLHRMAYMMSGCFLLMIPLVLSRIEARQRRYVCAGLIVVILLYCQFVQNVQPY